MHKKAYNYYLKQANKYWSELRSRLSEAHIASATYRFNRKKVTNEILKSLRERALHSEELGMYWKSSPNSYFWYHAPISIQTQMIELFSQVGAKESEIDKLKIWLLKQKQTTAWKTSTDSTNAVYSLLIEGSDWLKDRTLTQVALGKLVINSENNKTNKVKAGSGFYEKHFGAKEIIPNMGNITISKRNEGVSWGAVHWEYFEDLSKVTSHKSPLSIAKIVLVRKNDKKGPKLIRLGTAQVEVGDTLVSRLVVKVDRDMEYVHLKDMRGSGVEPLNVLSSYQFLDGLFYYVSTKDTATHYYFEILPKGTYVFEYDSRVFHRGVYQLGFANIRSFYAPEFSSHSKSFKVKVN